jgi:hypothetical protein
VIRYSISFVIVFIWSANVFASIGKKCAAHVKSQIETENLNSIKKQVESKLGSKISIKVSKSFNTFIHIMDKESNILGWADFYLTDDNFVKIVNIQIEPRYQRSGISKLIIAKILKITPQALGVKVSYTEINEKVLNEYLVAGYSLKEAIVQTPTYKSLAANGLTDFHEIRYFEQNKKLMDFTVKKAD